MSLIHLAYAKRSDGHIGGVPKFGSYLEKHLGAVNLAWSDLCPSARQDAFPEHEKALLLAAGLLNRGLIGPQDRIIADGFWANGLPADFNVTVVAHGTWAEFATRGRAGVPPAFIEAQAEAYQARPVVAVSDSAARQCREYYGVEPAATIFNGIDLAEFAPPAILRPRPLRPRVVHVGKGPAILNALGRLLPDFDLAYLSADAGEEAEKFRRGDLFVFPSRAEGDAYALIEALACGVPTVASDTGRMEGQVGETAFGEVLDVDARAEEYAEALRRVWKRREQCAVGARTYAVANADAERWAREWRAYLRLEAPCCP